jgi:hypothetical protein
MIFLLGCVFPVSGQVLSDFPKAVDESLPVILVSTFS